MSLRNDPLNEMFRALRSSGAANSDSFSQALEDRLMVEQERMSRRAGRPYLVLALCGLIVAGGAVSYAATEGWTVWSFSVGADGIVTDQDGEAVGASLENDDGSFTTTIFVDDGRPETDHAYEVHTDGSVDGRQIMIAPAPAK